MDEHTILAASDDFGTISICPGGVIHVNLAHYSLKFLPAEFTKLADLMGKARLNLGDRPQLTSGKPRLQVVSRDPQDCSAPDPTE